MASGKNTRLDSRRSSSSYCSTVTIVVFVALCLVGVWMLMSSSIVPEGVSNYVTRSDAKQQVSQDDGRFEDGSGDVMEDATKEIADASKNRKLPKDEQKEQETEEESPNKETEDDKNDSEDAPKDQTYSDENGKMDDGGTTTENKEGSQGDGNKEEESAKKTDVTDDEQQQNESENKSSEELPDDVKDQAKIEQTLEGTEQNSSETNNNNKNPNEVYPDPAQSELLNETDTQKGKWSTQSQESEKEKEAQKSSSGQVVGQSWKLCNVSAGSDYIPCLDNMDAIMKLTSTKHYEHRERHCPKESPTCLVPLPEGYKRPVKWPNSRDKIWYANVPHTKLAVVKGHQNWVKVTGEYLTFPGGGTQFKNGALHYIDNIQESLPDIAWGKRSRVLLDVGCGVASFGGFLFERDVLAMSFAPKDEHEAQVQFALERGIPAISAVMGTKRLPFPGNAYDVVHCARCRVPWHIEGGMLLLELNRLLRPGGYFVWSATPVYRSIAEDVEIWDAMSKLTKAMCWETVTKTNDTLNQVGVAIFKKPSNNECYDQRVENSPPICQGSDDPNAAWNVPLQACLHRVPVDLSLRGSKWPEQWPKRLEAAPYWLDSSQLGVYGQAAPEDFKADYKHWKRVVSKSYLNGVGIDWSNVRNVMDMRAVYGGFAAALSDMKMWVMNVVSVESADTLPIIFERGLFGIYHDWCESFSTYPRTYDLLHADHLFSNLKKRCNLLPVIAEVDRILRPEGKLIVRDNIETISEVEKMARSLQWEVRMTYSKDKEGLLCVEKTAWRPKEVDSSI